MDSEEIGRAYDALAEWWNAEIEGSTTGVRYLERAIGLVEKRGRALDAGCGGGRLVGQLEAAGFEVVGLDVSAAQLEIARQRHPRVRFVHTDFGAWPLDGVFDLVIAWDSLFHVPRAAQRAVTEKLCDAVAPGGVVLMTAGGIDGEITGEMAGHRFGYGSLDARVYLEIVESRGCRCVLLERDQLPDEHLVVIAKRV